MNQTISPLNAKNSAILHIPKLSESQLEDEEYLRHQVQKMSKKLDRDRRKNGSDLKATIGGLRNDLVTAKSLVAPADMHSDPAVLGVRYRLEQAQYELQQFQSDHSTQGYIEKVHNNRHHSGLAKKSVEKSILFDWSGPKSTARNDKSVWSEHLGGRVDRSLCQIQLVHHKRHWDPTHNVRGLVAQAPISLPSLDQKHNPLHYVQQAVTMASPQRHRQQREADPLLDCSPSPRHASKQYVRSLVPNQTKHHLKLESNFKYGKLVGDKIPEANIDHPCFGTPFATQQVVRTILDRTIEHLEQELTLYPKYGMTAREQKPKAAIEQALGEYLRVRKEMTGTRAAALEKRVAEAKKRVKGKLSMMMALKSKGFGDFSFLQTIKDAEEKATTPRPATTEEKAKQSLNKMFG